MLNPFCVNFSVTTIVGPGFIVCGNDLFGNGIHRCYASLFLGLSQSLQLSVLTFPTRSASGLPSNAPLCLDHSCLGSLL